MQITVAYLTSHISCHPNGEDTAIGLCETHADFEQIIDVNYHMTEVMSFSPPLLHGRGRTFPGSAIELLISPSVHSRGTHGSMSGRNPFPALHSKWYTPLSVLRPLPSSDIGRKNTDGN